MASVDTPKKPAKRGRPSSKAANDCCRLCACNLKVKFGDFKKTTYVSTENLFQSKREGSECNKTLAELCSQMGLHVANSTALSDRVCRPCGRKIRNAFQLYTFIKGSLENALSQDTPSQDSASEDSTSARFKQLLPSSVSSPDRSPRPKKGQRRSSEAKKSLSFLENSENELLSEGKDEEMITPQVNKPLVEHNFNVDDLLSYQSTQVKVAIVNPSCCVDVHSQFDENMKSMILNLCRKNWSTVANLALRHPNVRSEIGDSLRKAVGEEFKEYCGEAADSVLKKSSPDDLAAYSNSILVYEAEVWCPLWMSSLKGACNVSDLV